MGKKARNNTINDLIIFDEKINNEKDINLQILLKGDILNLDKNSINISMNSKKNFNIIEKNTGDEYVFNIKLKYINEEIKTVTNGMELQMALNDERVQTIFMENGEYKLSNELIVISSKGKVIMGNKKTIFTDGIIIKADVYLKGIKFNCEASLKNNNSYIYICNGAYVTLEDIEIRGNNLENINGIILERNSISKLSIKNSFLNNLNVGIEVNEDNTLCEVINNVFDNIKIGIDNLKKGAVIQDINLIKDNKFILKTYSEDITFSSGVNIGKEKNIKIVTNGVNFARDLSLNNNYAFVKGYGIFSDIQTQNYQVSSDEELAEVLKLSNNGTIIKLLKGKYYGNILINKEIALIGEEKNDVIIIPNEKYNENIPQYGIKVSGSNLLIKNLTIDGQGNNTVYYFRDGIRYQQGIPNNNNFKEISIKNIHRRGISIWPETVSNTNIENCIIENIKQQAIYMNGSGKIKNCVVKNSQIGIQVNNKIKVGINEVENNIICNNEKGILICNNEKDCSAIKVKLKDNFLKDNLFEIEEKFI